MLARRQRGSTSDLRLRSSAHPTWADGETTPGIRHGKEIATPAASSASPTLASGARAAASETAATGRGASKPTPPGPAMGSRRVSRALPPLHSRWSRARWILDRRLKNADWINTFWPGAYNWRQNKLSRAEEVIDEMHVHRSHPMSPADVGEPPGSRRAGRGSRNQTPSHPPLGPCGLRGQGDDDLHLPLQAQRQAEERGDQDREQPRGGLPRKNAELGGGGKEQTISVPCPEGVSLAAGGCSLFFSRLSQTPLETPQC